LGQTEQGPQVHERYKLAAQVKHTFHYRRMGLQRDNGHGAHHLKHVSKRQSGAAGTDLKLQERYAPHLLFVP
jgi:hypothetical protein